MTSRDFLGLEGKTVLITGASSGIGRETALRASRYGAKVAIVARRRDKLEEVLSELDGAGHVAKAYDLVDTDGIPQMVRSLSDELDGLDGLVHAAGVHSATPLRAVRANDVREIFELNVTSAVMLAKGFRHKQVSRPGASVVFLSSAAGTVGQPGVSVYSASKGAIAALTRSLALELARDGLRVNCVSPGVVRTEMTVGLEARIGPRAFAEVAAAHPLGLGEVGDVASAVLFLLSMESRWITGTSLAVDGGYTAQ